MPPIPEDKLFPCPKCKQQVSHFERHCKNCGNALPLPSTQVRRAMKDLDYAIPHNDEDHIVARKSGHKFCIRCGKPIPPASPEELARSEILARAKPRWADIAISANGLMVFVTELITLLSQFVDRKDPQRFMVSWFKLVRALEAFRALGIVLTEVNLDVLETLSKDESSATGCLAQCLNGITDGLTVFSDYVENKQNSRKPLTDWYRKIAELRDMSELLARLEFQRDVESN